MKKPRRHHEFDVITVTPDGSVVWRRYDDRKIVTAGPRENPRDALARQLREKRKRGKR
jgi:hypothetical protein